MDTNERFDQLESLLVDLTRRVDGLDEKVNKLDEKVDKQGKLLTIVSEQVDTIVGFLKLSEARHTQAEQRQDAMLVEIREQGREIKEQGRRLDTALNVQLQMLQLMRTASTKTEELTSRLEPLESQEPRIKRLEDQVFRAAS